VPEREVQEEAEEAEEVQQRKVRQKVQQKGHLKMQVKGLVIFVRKLGRHSQG
jgi:hypothetical protein